MTNPDLDRALADVEAALAQTLVPPVVVKATRAIIKIDIQGDVDDARDVGDIAAYLNEALGQLSYASGVNLRIDYNYRCGDKHSRFEKAWAARTKQRGRET